MTQQTPTNAVATNGPIVRIGKNGCAYECKTARIRGDLTERVMDVARRMKQFTRHDILNGSDQVYNRLHNLTKQGVLKIVRKGTNGPGGNCTIYKLNK